MTRSPIELSWTANNFDIETERQKTERQEDNKTKDDEYDSEDVQTTSNDLLRSKNRGWGGDIKIF